jgi:hypothetical protein
MEGEWREQLVQAQEAGEQAVLEAIRKKEDEMKELVYRCDMDIAKAAGDNDRCVCVYVLIYTDFSGQISVDDPYKQTSPLHDHHLIHTLYRAMMEAERKLTQKINEEWERKLADKQHEMQEAQKRYVCAYVIMFMFVHIYHITTVSVYATFECKFDRL